MKKSFTFSHRIIKTAAWDCARKRWRSQTQEPARSADLPLILCDSAVSRDVPPCFPIPVSPATADSRCHIAGTAKQGGQVRSAAEGVHSFLPRWLSWGDCRGSGKGSAWSSGRSHTARSTAAIDQSRDSNLSAK